MKEQKLETTFFLVWSEQAREAANHDFKQERERRKRERDESKTSQTTSMFGR